MKLRLKEIFFKRNRGTTMKDYIHIRVDSDLKEKFRQVAEEQNPGLPKSQAMSAVVREMIVSYVKKHQRGGNLQ